MEQLGKAMVEQSEVMLELAKNYREVLALVQMSKQAQRPLVEGLDAVRDAAGLLADHQAHVDEELGAMSQSIGSLQLQVAAVIERLVVLEEK